MESRKKRVAIEEHEKFIISMSDQQLVTGLAILVALYIKSCSVSVYSFEIALSLAYFSCSIHISTLTVLRRYLQKYKTLAFVRVVLMVTLAIMLLAGLLILQSGTFYELPATKLGCVLADFDSHVSQNLSWVQIGNTVMVCWFIISAYMNFIFELYDGWFPKFPGNWYFWFALSVGMTQHDKNDQCKILSGWQKEKVLSEIKDQRLSRIRKILIFTPYILEEFSRSFLYKILWMLFYFTFGVSAFCVYWTQQGLYKHVLDVWGFGQLVPVFLLVLPLLSAYEFREESLSDVNLSLKGFRGCFTRRKKMEEGDHTTVQMETTHDDSAAQENKKVDSTQISNSEDHGSHKSVVSDQCLL